MCIVCNDKDGLSAWMCIAVHTREALQNGNGKPLVSPMMSWAFRGMRKQSKIMFLCHLLENH